MKSSKGESPSNFPKHMNDGDRKDESKPANDKVDHSDDPTNKNCRFERFSEEEKMMEQESAIAPAAGAANTSVAKLHSFPTIDDDDNDSFSAPSPEKEAASHSSTNSRLLADLGHKHPDYGMMTAVATSGVDGDHDDSTDSRNRDSSLRSVESTAAEKQEHRGSFIQAVEAAALTKRKRQPSGASDVASSTNSHVGPAKATHKTPNARGTAASRSKGKNILSRPALSEKTQPRMPNNNNNSSQEKLSIANKGMEAFETRSGHQGGNVRSSFDGEIIENSTVETQPGAFAVPGINSVRDRLGIPTSRNNNTWESEKFETENDNFMENEAPVLENGERHVGFSDSVDDLPGSTDNRSSSSEKRDESIDLVAVVLDENELENEIRKTILMQSTQAEVVSIDDRTTSTGDNIWKKRGVVLLVLVVVGTIIGLFVGLVRSQNNDLKTPSLSPSSSMPTITPLPTLETIIERGALRCAVNGHRRQEKFCRALTAAIFGDASKYEPVKIALSDPYSHVANKSADVGALLSSASMDTDVFEEENRVGFTFASPIYLNGIGFGGIPKFVNCADRLDGFFDECNKIRICAATQDSYEAVNQWFPPSRIRLVGGDMILKTFMKGLCNVICGLDFETSEEFVRNMGNYTGPYEVGETSLSKATIAMMTREDDREWSDFVQWTMRALITAEQKNISRSKAGEFYTTQVFGGQFEKMFVNAIATFGNLFDLYAEQKSEYLQRRPRITEVNNGSTGLIFSLPFGENLLIVGPRPVEGSTIYNILQRGSLRCGVTVTPDTDTWRDLGMNYCQALAAGLFEGDATKIEFINITSIKNAYTALDKGQVDILSGARITLEADVKEPSTGKGFTFSLPFFYDPVWENESYSYANSDSIGLVTRETDNPWSDFVFWMVSATFFAEEEGITQTFSMDMPSVNLFGSNLVHMYRNAIAEVGNYGEMYDRSVVTIPREGRNLLNKNPYGPQFDPTFALQ